MPDYLGDDMRKEKKDDAVSKDEEKPHQALDEGDIAVLKRYGQVRSFSEEGGKGLQRHSLGSLYGVVAPTRGRCRAVFEARQRALWCQGERHRFGAACALGSRRGQTADATGATATSGALHEDHSS